MPTPANAHFPLPLDCLAGVSDAVLSRLFDEDTAADELVALEVSPDVSPKVWAAAVVLVVTTVRAGPARHGLVRSLAVDDCQRDLFLA